MNVIISSRTITHANAVLKTDVSGTSALSPDPVDRDNAEGWFLF
jgi:hypothetical protein